MKVIKIKRIYLSENKSDGYRILVDRLWPRGIKKEEAKIDLWLKDIAPSNELRKWFNHEVEKWSEFKKRYYEELAKKQDLIQVIKEHARTQSITLLYGTKDEKYNNANVLREFLKN